MAVAGDVLVPSDQASMSRNANALRPPASDSEIRDIAFLQAIKNPLMAGFYVIVKSKLSVVAPDYRAIQVIRFYEGSHQDPHSKYRQTQKH